MEKVTRVEFYVCIHSYKGSSLQKITCINPYRCDIYIYGEDEVGRAYPETEEYFLNV